MIMAKEWIKIMFSIAYYLGNCETNVKLDAQ